MLNFSNARTAHAVATPAVVMAGGYWHSNAASFAKKFSNKRASQGLERSST